jgi:hypothetical protein
MTETDWWEEKDDGGHISFSINREHPLYLSLVEKNCGIKSALNEIFNRIETALPVTTIHAIMCGNPKTLTDMKRPFNAEGVRYLAGQLKESGRNREKTFELLKLDCGADGEHDNSINDILDEVFS